MIVSVQYLRTSTSARARSLQTIKVLGFHDGESASYIYRETSVLCTLGILAGFVFGVFLHSFAVRTAEVRRRNVRAQSDMVGLCARRAHDRRIHGACRSRHASETQLDQRGRKSNESERLSRRACGAYEKCRAPVPVPLVPLQTDKKSCAAAQQLFVPRKVLRRFRQKFSLLFWF